MIKKVRYFIQSLIIYLFFFVAKIMGLKLSRYIFSYLFIKLGNLFKSKKIIFNNLNKINPSLNIDEKETIIKKMWSNYGKTFSEYVHLGLLRKKTNHITIKNKQIIDQIIKEDKPVVFISGHFANYELMSMELRKAKIKLATIYRPLNNIFLNPFMEYIRKKFVCENQIKKGLSGVKEALNYMKNNYSIALMVDQRVSEGPRVLFFNHGAHTTTLPAQLSKRFNSKIVPISIKRDENDDFEMEILEPIKLDDNMEVSKDQVAKKINKIIEKLILKDPSQWILTHNRWK